MKRRQSAGLSMMASSFRIGSHEQEPVSSTLSRLCCVQSRTAAQAGAAPNRAERLARTESAIKKVGLAVSTLLVRWPCRTPNQSEHEVRE